MFGKSATKARTDGSDVTPPEPAKTVAAEGSSAASAPLPVELKSEVGFTAGKIWNVLSSEGPLTVAQLKKKVTPGGEIVSLAIGWLAREDKVDIQAEKRNLMITLH